MRILVTGALGHIGSKLIKHLIKNLDDLELIMVDNFLTQRYNSLFNLPRSKKLIFVEGDILSLDLYKLFKNIDVVIHLAAITDAASSFEKKDLIESHNLDLTQKVVGACVANRSKLIFISTTSVYGTSKDIVFEDCLEDLNPQSPYAETKIKEEEFVKLQSKQNNLSSIICRFGTIYGVSKGIRFHTAVNKFCWQASLKLPITVWETAYEQKRPYLDLNDACNAISFIITNKIFDNEVYNILTHNRTVKQIVETIKFYIPALKIEFVKAKIMNQLSYDVSDEKFKLKGFKYHGNLKKSIGQTLDLLKNLN